MANYFTSFLDNVGQGLTNPKGNLGDFAHAARLYNDSAFRFAPKTKFLYHVVFNFHPSVIGKTAFKEQHQTTVGMLVKAVDLPKFKITVDTVEQYNRKRQLQTRLDYEPIQLQFHDDNSGVTTALWSFYYGYYFADSGHGGSSGANLSAFGNGGLMGFIGNLVPGVSKLLGIFNQANGSAPIGTIPAYQRNSYKGESFNKYRYGLDNNSSAPFFTSIQIFQMGKQRYQSYTLINPIITSWQHDRLDNSDGAGTTANTMQIAYEAVIYGSGAVSQGNPKGFATQFYDHSPSPLGIGGGGTTSLFGQGGVVGGAADVFGSILSGAAFTSPGAFLGTIVKGANVVTNAKKLTSAGLRQEGYNILTGALGAASGVYTTGVANTLFPKNNGNGQNQSTSTSTPGYDNNGPLPASKVQAFFKARPGALTSLAKSTVFQKERGLGNINDVNTAWNALPTSTKALYEQQALEKVINGAPEVQSQYNLIKRQA